MNKEKRTILAIDDELTTIDLYKTIFTSLTSNYNFLTAYTGKKAIEICKNEKVDLIILDLKMPDLDGKVIFDCIKKKSKNIGVIVITGLNDVKLAVQFTKMGAFEYMVKPFEPNELLAVVESFFHPIDYRKGNKNIIEHAGIRMDLKYYEVTVDGNRISLTPKEFDLLYIFMRNPDKLMSREEICEKLYGNPEMAKSKALNTHLRRLKNKLSPSVAERIKAITGKGIIFCTQ